MRESGIVYLATPYAHPDEKIREERFRRVSLVAAMMIRQGIPVFSPISHEHPIATAFQAGDLHGRSKNDS